MTAFPFLTATAVCGLLLSGAVQAQSGLSRCGGAAGPALPDDCMLEAPPLMLGFDYTPTTADLRRGNLSITQSTPEGGTRDVTGPFEVAGGLQPPVLRDIDNDGLAELLIQSRPAAYDVWVLNADGFYRIAGRVRAQSLAQISQRGALIVGEVRDGAGQITETAYLLDGAEVVTVFRMRIDPDSRSCSLIDGAAEAQDWLNADVLLAECEARDWND
ncbi:hypothetical protein [Flavimaricola marinus]|uniref:hypothetical protein n=1 Tax=Flavimaricola marinus TaxID=1819565 RepID=UPI0010566DC3|nr:hypothetical protein [Flavimaricola marinus]